MFNFFILLIIILSSTVSIFASDCHQNCGSATVPYPFGFSPNCKIPLNCSYNTKSIGIFPVLNITSSSIFLDVSPSCNRTLDSASQFFSNNFALKKSNGLFLRNCNSSSFEKCSISTSLISDRLNTLKCGYTNDNLSCFANVTENEGNFTTIKEIFDTGCSFLFSSVAYKAEQSLAVLTFSEVELEWWMDGKCNCSDNANCKRVISPVPKGSAYRCECKEGFVGDGFKSGRGCKVSRTVSRKSVGAGLLAGVITAGASITLLTAFLTYHIRHRRNSSKTNKTTKRLLSESSFNVPFYPYKTIERATDNFSDTHRLGTGAYGTVYVGTLSNNNLIAVKKIKHPEPETISQVMNEVKMISSVNHPNLVHLLGCCIDRGEQILVYEFMPNGTLSEHLQRQRGPGLPWTIRLGIATETAKALAYLHSQVQPPIYHRDIKSSNILLDYQFNAKIADFGLSRSIMSDCSHVSTAPQGTPGYVDPQYHQNYHLSDKSDVYSFGVVLVEIISAMRVVDFNRGQTEINLAALAVDRIAKGKVEEIIDPFMNVKKDSWVFESVHKVAELAFRCLAFHRDMRPTMVEVADELEQIRVSVWAPKDGEVELCTFPLIGREGKSKRVVFVSGRMEEEKVNNSPVSVQDNWKSEQSTPSSSSLLGYSNQ